MGTRPARWVPRENSFFRETLGESAPVGPRIGVFGGPLALRCQRLGQSSGMRPLGYCRGAMWVPCWVGGYHGKTRFLGRLWVQESWGGGYSDYGGSRVWPQCSLRTGQSSGVAALGCYRGDMWVLDPPGGYPGKTRFLGRPWAKVLRWDPE